MIRSSMAALALSFGSCTAPSPRPTPPDVAVMPAPTPPDFRPPTAITLEGVAEQGGLVTGTAPTRPVSLTLDGQPVAVAANGRFIIAWGRDAPATSVLSARFADGRTETQTIAVAPRIWSTQTIGSVRRRPLPDAEFERVRAVEIAEMVAARQRSVESDGWRQRFAWPVTGRVSGVFGSQRIYARGERDGFHNGVDVARPSGTPVLAPADGVVILATTRPYTLEGYMVIVDHGHALSSTFLHLSRIDVATGARVRQGQSLGAIGTTGRSSGPHLHWGMRWQDARIDPARVAGPMPPA